MRRGTAIGLVTVAVTGAGCGGGDSGPKPLQSGDLVSLTRTGRMYFDRQIHTPLGKQTIMVRRDGHAIISNSAGLRVLTLDPKTTERLRRDLRRSHFSELSSEEDRISPPDAHRYAITYGSRTVRRSGWPSELKRTVETLSGWLDLSARPRDIFIRVRRRGGFAFKDVTVSVSNDGRVDQRETGPRRGRRRFRMGAQTLGALKQSVVDLRLAEVRSSKVPPPADGYVYVYEVTTDPDYLYLHSLYRMIRAPQGKIAPALQPVISLTLGSADRTAS
ncbi:MAG: hypothetical protein M3Z33_01985 [Actinomycetota bacterium]|nr:hypothetical protein [Actinomycetota bacterium]